MWVATYKYLFNNSIKVLLVDIFMLFIRFLSLVVTNIR